MSTIDEIMGAATEYGDACWRGVNDDADEAWHRLRDLIAAALADAEKRGAEQMREAAAQHCRKKSRQLANRSYLIASEEADESVTMQSQAWKLMVVEDEIRALPLPAGPRQVVRLTDDLVREIAYQAGCFGEEFDITGAQTDKLCRAIETAVLAANGLETK